MKCAILVGAIFLFFYSCRTKDSLLKNCDSLRTHFSQVVAEYKEKRNTREVLLSLDRIIEGHYCLEALILRGDIYSSLDSNKQALESYKMASLLDTNDIYILFRIGIISELEKDYHSAVVYYSSAISKKMVGRFVVDFNSDFEKQVSGRIMDIDYNKLKFRRGVAGYHEKDLSMSLSDLNYCIDQNYLLSKSYYYRGLVYSEEKRIENACLDFRRADSLGNVDAHMLVSQYCHANKKEKP